MNSTLIKQSIHPEHMTSFLFLWIYRFQEYPIPSTEQKDDLIVLANDRFTWLWVYEAVNLPHNLQHLPSRSLWCCELFITKCAEGNEMIIQALKGEVLWCKKYSSSSILLVSHSLPSPFKYRSSDASEITVVVSGQLRWLNSMYNTGTFHLKLIYRLDTYTCWRYSKKEQINLNGCMGKAGYRYIVID